MLMSIFSTSANGKFTHARGKRRGMGEGVDDDELVDAYARWFVLVR